MKRILTAFLLALCVLCLAPGISGAASQPGVYYQHFASSPHPDFDGECLVVQWYQIQHLGGGAYFDVEAILFADGRILLQYGPGDPEQGTGTTVGVQTAAGDAVQYYCEYGYGGGIGPDYQEKTYDAPTGIFGMSSGPIPGNMALLFTPVEEEEAFQPSITPWTYNITSAPYSMVDIHNTGHNINIYGDDTYDGAFDIGFDFPFYASSYDQFYASTNCLLSFNGGSSDFSNSCLPTGDPDLDMIAVFWDDMYVNNTPYVAEEGTAEDAYTKYKDYTKNRKDKKFFGNDCFISAAAGGTNMLFPLLMAAVCAAGGFLSRKRMGK